jgi:hypothetical protein
MAAIDEACREIVDSVDGAVACAVVDLTSGRLLGIHSPHCAQALKDALAQAALQLLRGPSVGRIESVIGGQAPHAEASVQEVHVMSGDNHHFARLLKGGKAGVMLVTNRATNVSLGSAQMKAALPKVEPHLR